MADTLSTPAPVLSFPAILRNPGLKDRYAHLYGGSSRTQESAAGLNQVRVKKIRRDQNEGKRWVRRKDNAHFIDNPHIVTATKKDYILPIPSNKPTFPEPLPSYLPRVAKVPVGTPPTRDPVSANAGRFSLSMKGMRKELRRAGGRAEVLVRDVEAQMLEWLQGGVMLQPDESNATGLVNLQVTGMGRQVGSTGVIREVSRTPLQMVWSIADDAFARYVVHCCARYHQVVSFSKGDSTERLTYLLRPNVQKPDYGAISTLDTPPITDVDNSSQVETSDVDSDLISDRDLVDSDIEESDPRPRTMAPGSNLDSIQEASIPSSPRASVHNDDDDDDEWTTLSVDADALGDESSSEVGQDLIESIDSLNLEDNVGQETTSTNADELLRTQTLDQANTQDAVDVIRVGDSVHIPRRGHHQPHLPGRRWIRNTSSPSRSPVRPRRFTPRKNRQLAANFRAAASYDSNTFYDYIFS